MRYYESKYPEVDELVMVQVRQIAEMGAYVKLLEYDGIEVPIYHPPVTFQAHTPHRA